MKVVVKEPLGAETHLIMSTKTQQAIVRCSPDLVFQIGETVNFQPLMEKAKFFDKETELSICDDVKAE
jgi:multiple sugar transport system ATP-binding protein